MPLIPSRSFQRRHYVEHIILYDKCSGSIAAFLDGKSRVLITHGASADGRLLNDSWLLDTDFGYAEQVSNIKHWACSGRAQVNGQTHASRQT
jgi:hypothetical protein